MTRTLHPAGPGVAHAGLTAALEAANLQLHDSEDLAITLIGIGVRHPAYLGSNGTRSALHRDLLAASDGRVGPTSLARITAYLVKRGWYVDTSSDPESLASWAVPDDFVMEVAEIAPRRALLMNRIARTYTVKDHDWIMLPYVLVEQGFTHPDFRPYGVDPTAALDRDLDEILERLSSFGEGVWACFLAERGWTVDTSKERWA